MVLAELYLILLECIKRKLPEIKHVDWWNDQLDMEEDEDPFLRPAIFWEFDVLETTQLGNKVQLLKVSAKAHLVTDAISETAMRTKKAVRERAIRKHTDLIDKVHKCFHGYNGLDQGVQFGSMQHVGNVLTHNYDAVRRDETAFLCMIYDRAAVRKTVKRTPKEKITVTGSEL